MKVPKLDRLAPHSIVSDSRPGLNILQMNEHDEGNHGGQVWELDFRFTTNKFPKTLVANRNAFFIIIIFCGKVSGRN